MGAHPRATLEHLFESAARAEGASPVKIREAWAIDCPNHGDAAVLNEVTLKWGYDNFSWEEYARAVHIFLAGLGRGVDVDFSKRNLAGIGHSMGCIALTLSTTYCPKLSLQSFIFVEPTLFPDGSVSPHTTSALTDTTEKRRDIFPSREEAFAWLRSRSGYEVWDTRVLRIFVEHGMRELPTAEYPDKQGVTLKCTRRQEAACYRDHYNTGRVRAYNYLPVLCAARPVHVVFGEIGDFLPVHVQDRALEEGFLGKYMSARRVRGAGHMIVQTHPKQLADAIWAVWNGQPAPRWEKTKL